jgi:D-alanyl-D-alanine carboxypeptidase (penicillin-binding protein 5/6)
VKHLKTGENFAYRPDEPMPTASLIKFPIMATAYEYAEQKKIKLSTLVELKETDKVPGSGILTTHFSAGSKFSVRDLIRLMIVYSDNTATNMVIDQIGLPATSKFMARINLANTQLNAKVFRADTSIAPEDRKKFGLGNTTAAQTLRLYEMLHKQQLVSKAASAEMLGHLRLCEDKSKLARYLPASAKIAHKGGSVTASRCDAGIIESPSGAIAICVLTTGNSDKRWITDNAANRLCANIAKSAYDYFNPTTGVTQSPVVLKIGASGRLVEDLQRTLNARLKPSPELSIDGEFGGVTLKAIERFQTLNKLEADGIVDKTTWAALGTLQTQPTPVDDPTTINSQTTKRETADSLTGAPHVTCKAWAIADAQTGKLLWSNDENKQLNFASTTKIMTAFIVINLAESKPSVLEETVTFSVRADKTGGSTAGIRAGEQLTVGELLYGLLLPSGNDASVALAEHFGRQFTDKKNKQKESPTPTPAESYDVFIAKMNDMARSLGMSTTTYKNPHGLTAKGHLSSAADLLKLAYAAMQIPRFREYVNTPQHGCSLTSTSGYQRNVVWKNTNRLLGIEGYAGVKTGTTSAAGACLVSHATRGDDQLLLVVLGAQSSTARYVDSRNLYRWAWLQRGHKE